MAADDIKQITLQPGQFAWCRDEKSGALRLYVGPTRLTPTDDDVFLKQDPKDPGRLIPVTSIVEAAQDFVTVHSGEYAVVHNPVVTRKEDWPNGQYTGDKNTLPELEFGKTRVLTSGHFPVWPGQRVEVRPVHELQSNEYLIVRVVDASRVDDTAPFFALTEECAGITAAVVDATDTSPPPPNKTEGGEGEGAETALDAHPEPVSPPTQKSAAARAPDDAAQPKKAKLTTGQHIVIPGSKTPTYIPPTGVEVVPDSSVDDSGRPVTPNFARVLLDTFERRRTGAAQPAMRGGPSHMPVEVNRDALLGQLTTSISRGEENRRSLREKLSLDERDAFEGEYTSAVSRSSDERAATVAAMRKLQTSTLMRISGAVKFEDPVVDLEAGTVSGASVEELKAIASGPRLVRQAVVLGPTEFCVLLDADGRPQIHKGPGRVFPGPNDRFQTKGSRNRVYDAYHLRSDRGLLLRIVAERITHEALLQELPQGLPDRTLEKETYLKGDEVFVGGFDAYLVPSNSFEVINPGLRIQAQNPTTRSPHIGNDHSDVYVQAIGVDQKSGVYVMNVETGQVELVRGEKKLLLDPRRQRHVLRRVPGKAWNLIIGRAEPHKMVRDDAIVETPWALSVIIPNNEAVLVTSKSGRRVVLGPCTELLGYEEWLEKLTLSRGRPKSEAQKLETCFLRVSGNRVTDRIVLQTADFVSIVVDVSYGVTFVGETEADRFMWFDHRNYVRLLYTHLRSRLQAAARKRTLMEIHSILPDFIRDTVLGVKKEGEDHRPGLHLDNKMCINEVEVLDINIPDDNVSKAMQRAQQEAVVRQIGDTALQQALVSDSLRAEISSKQHTLRLYEIERDSAATLAEVEAAHEEANQRAENLRAIEEATARHREVILDLAAEAANERKKQSAALVNDLTKAQAEVDLDIEDRKNKAAEALKKALAEVEIMLIGKNAEAVELQLKAVQPGLIEAIDGLGDKQLLQALAENLPEAGGTLGFLLGQGGLEALSMMIKGTGLEKTLGKLGLSGSSS